jgi:hypothetical protein
MIIKRDRSQGGLSLFLYILWQVHLPHDQRRKVDHV